MGDLIGSNPFDVIAADFNRDGHLDLAVAEHSQNDVVILIGNGDGTFAAPYHKATGNQTAPSAVVAADFDGNGSLDLATANSQSGNVSVLFGYGDGTFSNSSQIPASGFPYAIAAGDLNGDGHVDLVVAGGTEISILLGNGDGTFASPTALTTTGADFRQFVLADFNSDGKLDVALADYGSGAVQVLPGNGDGTLQQAQPYQLAGLPVSLSLADFDRDGNPDLAVATAGDNQVSILFGYRDGTFLIPTSGVLVPVSPHKVVTGDFNGDGNVDVAVTTSLNSSEVDVIPGDGRGDLGTVEPQRVTNSHLWGLVGADLNGDGQLDLAFTDTSNNAYAVMLGLGGPGLGTFTGPTSLTVGLNPGGAVAVDLNRDGQLDLAVSNEGSDSVGVLHGSALGFLPQVTFATGMDPVAIAAGDLDRDGHLDLVTANSQSDSISVLSGLEDGGFADHVDFALDAGSQPQSLVLVDLDHDGRLDIATANKGNQSVSVFLQAPDGGSPTRVDHAVAASPESLRAADFNRDGLMDLVCTSTPNDQVVVILGQPDGGLSAPHTSAAGTRPHQLVVGDFDGDGKLDVAVANDPVSGVPGSIMVLHGKGDGTFSAGFSATVGQGAGSIAAGDLNRDGHLDLVVTTSSSSDAQVYFGDGLGNFFAGPQLTGLQSPRALVTGDFDRNGALDVAALNSGSGSVGLYSADACP